MPRGGGLPTDIVGDLDRMARSFARHLRAENKSPKTVETYGTLYSLAARIDQHLIRWALHKFKRLKHHHQRAWAWLHAVRKREPRLFATHWGLASAT